MKHNIFFGDENHSISVDECSGSSESAFLKTPFNYLQKQFGLERIMVLKQVHGTDGFVISNPSDIDNVGLREKDGDFLLTNCKNVGIAVLTADCLPIVFYDTHNNVVAIAHAGWKGTIGSIGTETLDAMRTTYGTKTADIEVFFGPCAKVCCYEVGQDFVEALQHDTLAQKALKKINDQWFFDMVLYNKVKLEEAGISSDKLHFDRNSCTICTPGFCSYRAQNKTRARNITLISLK